jgi:hypothetical protein
MGLDMYLDQDVQIVVKPHHDPKNRKTRKVRA